MRVDVLLDCVGDPVGLLRNSGIPDLKVVQHKKATDLPAKELYPLISGSHGVITSLTTQVDAAFLDAAGKNLKVVSNYGVGYDNIDLDAAKERGVVVCNTPPPIVEPTADMAWLLLFAAARRAREGLDLALSGKWTGYQPTQLLGHRFVGSTLLVVGPGRVGSAIARRALGWNMKVLYVANSPKPHLEAPPIGARQVSLQEGLPLADAVTVSVSLTPQTHHLFSKAEFAKMKSNAVFVNVSRGPVVDEAALATALDEGAFFGAGLDVYEKEPTINPQLLKNPRVFLMPHLGSATVEDRTDLTKLAVENTLAVLSGKEPPFRV